jgi:putative hydrolase of the HAD superfamily
MDRRSDQRVEAVLFDFGQVLSRPPLPAVWEQMKEIANLEEAPFHAGYWAYRHAYDRGDLTGPAYWEAVAHQAGSTFASTQVQELIDADTELWTDLNPPMVEWAARLQDAGFRTGILSNIGDSIAAGIIAKLPWLKRFDHCTWSHELHLAKPEAAIYLATAASLGTAPAQILFIDDREDNIAAAAALGMQTVRYTSHLEFERMMRAGGFGWLLDAEPHQR